MKAIYFRIDNTTALSYLVKMVGTKSKYLVELAKEIWKCFLHHGIKITAECLSSSINVEVDWQSRNSKNHSEWKLLPEIFQRSCQITGRPEMDFCFSAVSTTSTLHCMETRSIQSGNGCNAANIVQSVSLCFSTFFNNKQGFKKHSTEPSEKNVDCSSHIAISSNVTNLSENVNRETTYFTTPPTSCIKPPGSDTSTNNKQNIEISSLEGFRKRLLATRISERASKLISRTKRQGSLSKYNSSTISAYNEHIGNKPVGQNPHVHALLKGMFKQRSP